MTMRSFPEVCRRILGRVATFHPHREESRPLVPKKEWVRKGLHGANKPNGPMLMFGSMFTDGTCCR